MIDDNQNGSLPMFLGKTWNGKISEDTFGINVIVGSTQK
jgi:hypothetical protein